MRLQNGVLAKTEEWSKAGECREDGYEVLSSSFSGTMGNLFHEEIPVVRKVRQKCFDMHKFLLLIKSIFFVLLSLLTALWSLTITNAFSFSLKDFKKFIYMVFNSFTTCLCPKFS